MPNLQYMKSNRLDLCVSELVPVFQQTDGCPSFGGPWCNSSAASLFLMSHVTLCD